MAQERAAKGRASARATTATGERKRAQILDAAVRVFGTGGASAVTHRAVAQLADVPLGSTTYYFTDRNDLLLQAMAHAREAEAVRLTAIVDGIDSSLSLERAVTILTEMFFDKTVADPLYDLALFEMFMEATRNAAVREESREWSHMIFRLLDRVLPPTIADVPRTMVVEVVACLVDGLMLEAVSNGELTVADLSTRLETVLRRFCVV